MAKQQNTVEPVFCNNADMPDSSTSTMTVLKAVTGIIDAQYLEGVQNSTTCGASTSKIWKAENNSLPRRPCSSKGKWSVSTSKVQRSGQKN